MIRTYCMSRRLVAARIVGAFGLLASAPPTLAATSGSTTTTIDAQASVVVADPVGAGLSFDLVNDAISAVFLSGDSGDSVSLLLSGGKDGEQTAPRDDRAQRLQGGVVVMASGVYRIDLLTPVAGGRPIRLRSPLPGSGSILFLAQFN